MDRIGKTGNSETFIVGEQEIVGRSVFPLLGVVARYSIRKDRDNSGSI